MRRSSIAVIALLVLCSLGTLVRVFAATGESGPGSGSVGASQAGAPVYPGGKPINGGLITTTNYSKPTGTTVTFSTPDAFAKVYAYYKGALPSNAEASERNGAPTSRIGTFKYVKADGSQIDIEIQAYPGHTNYNMTHTFKK